MSTAPGSVADVAMRELARCGDWTAAVALARVVNVRARELKGALRHHISRGQVERGLRAGHAFYRLVPTAPSRIPTFELKGRP